MQTIVDAARAMGLDYRKALAGEENGMTGDVLTIEAIATRAAADLKARLGEPA